MAVDLAVLPVPFRDGAADATDQVINAGQTILSQVTVSNRDGVVNFFNLYDIATVVPGTTVPVFQCAIPNGLAPVVIPFPHGLGFVTQCRYNLSTALDGSGAPTTAGVVSATYRPV